MYYFIDLIKFIFIQLKNDLEKKNEMVRACRLGTCIEQFSWTITLLFDQPH